MIMNWDVFQVNDTIEWTWSPPYKPKTTLSEKIKYYLFKATNTRIKRVQLRFTEPLLKSCEKAKSLIKKYDKLPDLGLFLPQDLPERMVDTSKYLVELKD